MQFLFDVEIATKFGVNEAIFLNNLAFWTKTNQANGINFHDGHTWTYNSMKAFCTIFPFWTTDQIRTIIKKCLNYGLICIGNYNETKYDRKKWYALTEIGLKLFPGLICENSQMVLSELPNGFVKNPKPIADIKPDIKPDIKDKRGKNSPRVNSSVPVEFVPNEDHALLSDSLHLDLAREKNAFIDYYQAHGKKMVNWDAAFRNWLRKASEFRAKLSAKEHPVTASIRELKESIYDSEEFKCLMN